MIRDGRIRRIQFEYGPRNVYARVFLRDFFIFFDGLPYRIYKVMPRGLVPVATYDRRLENLQYKNFVALHAAVRVPGAQPSLSERQPAPEVERVASDGLG